MAFIMELMGVLRVPEVCDMGCRCESSGREAERPAGPLYDSDPVCLIAGQHMIYGRFAEG